MSPPLAPRAPNAQEWRPPGGGDGTLAFGAGLSDPDDPDVWLRDFTGRTRLWMEIGQPEDKPLAKACSKADRVRLYCFAHSADIWWRGIETKLSRLTSLEGFRVPSESSQQPAAAAAPSPQPVPSTPLHQPAERQG